MGILRSGHLHCHKCGNDLDGGEEICPHCGFHPRDQGLRLAAMIMMAVAVFFTITVLIGNYYPYIAGWTMLAVLLGFLAATAVFVISFMASPYRFSSFFRK